MEVVNLLIQHPKIDISKFSNQGGLWLLVPTTHRSYQQSLATLSHPSDRLMFLALIRSNKLKNVRLTRVIHQLAHHIPYRFGALAEALLECPNISTNDQVVEYILRVCFNMQCEFAVKLWKRFPQYRNKVFGMLQLNICKVKRSTEVFIGREFSNAKLNAPILAHSISH